MDYLQQPEIIASIIAAIASGGAIIASFRTSKSSNKLQKDINALQVMSADKQRLIEVISVQRVEWINKVRECFASFNTDAYIFSSGITQVIVQNIGVSSNVNSRIPNMIHQIELTELFLNPTEFVVKQLLKCMNNTVTIFTTFTQVYYMNINDREKLLELKSITQSKYQYERNRLMYLEQVILKVEWKRIKLETEKGQQISNKNMYCLYEEVAKQIDAELYRELLEKDFLESSYHRKTPHN